MSISSDSHSHRHKMARLKPCQYTGYICAVFVLSLTTYSDARYLSTMCILRLPTQCAVGERWDFQLCACVPDPAKCIVPRCPLRFHSPRCILYRKDSNGCQTCDCECDELSQICPVNCPNGTEMITKLNGCKECKCRPNLCKPVQCDNLCPNGRMEDINGCQTCNCKRNRKRHTCPPVMCAEACPYGTFEDTNNCPSCVCKPKPICPMLSCDNFCPSDREVDSNGCERCECKPVKPTKRTSCPPLSCSTRCPNGNELDKNGCSTCKCKSVLIWQQITRREGVL